MERGALLDVSGEGGGTVIVRAGRLMMDQSQIYAITKDNLDGAVIGVDIEVDNEFVITGSGIFSTTEGRGQGGKVKLEVGDLTLTGRAEIGAGASSRERRREQQGVEGTCMWPWTS